MSDLLSSRLFLALCRFVLGMVFVVAAVPKIQAPESFAVAVEAYEMLPLFAVNLAAILIPWIELTAGICIIAGARVRASAAILGFLLVFFAAAISTAILRGLNINCGCFGEGGESSPVGWGRVLEDLGLLIPAWLVYRGTPATAADAVEPSTGHGAVPGPVAPSAGSPPIPRID